MQKRLAKNTPKESETVSNIDYFGDPVYTYSLKLGIEDGFLAPFKVINVTLDISDGWRPYKGQMDIFGNEIEDRIYNNRDFDYPNGVILKDHINEVANEITEYLKSSFPIYLIKMKQKLIYTIGRNTALFKIKYLSSDFCDDLLHFIYRIILRIKAPL